VDGLQGIDIFHIEQPGKPGSWALWVLSIEKGGATVTVVSNKDQRKSDDQGIVNKEYRWMETIRFRGK
jgi:hypothetical protein